MTGAAFGPRIFKPRGPQSPGQPEPDRGRGPLSIGIEGRISIASGDADSWSKAAAAWEEIGATHLPVNTMRAGLEGPDQHIDAIRRFKEAVSG